MVIGQLLKMIGTFCEPLRLMEIQFNNGTIIAKLGSGWREDLPIATIFLHSPYWKWDSRIGMFRAPAHRLYSFLGELKSINILVQEAITQKHQNLSFNSIPLELRPYQIQAFSEWEAKNRRGVVILPTGAGKTRLALHAINSLKVKTLILVPTRILLNQWREEISLRLKIPVGILGDGQRSVENITVATYESAIRTVGNIGDSFQMVVVDEAHHFLTGERIEILEMLCAPFCLGLSATFSYQGSLNEKIQRLLGPIVFELTIEDLKGTVLAPFQKFLILINLNLVERKLYEGFMQVFRRLIEATKLQNPKLNSNELFVVLGRSSEGKKALSSLREARLVVSLCEEKVKKLEELLIRFKLRKVVIFTADTEAALRISSLLLVFPILAETPKRERSQGIELFITGKISALVTCRVLNEGFDVPGADVAIIIGGTHGERENIQRIGRVLRTAPGKSALIYELVSKDTIEVRQWRKRNHRE